MIIKYDEAHVDWAPFYPFPRILSTPKRNIKNVADVGKIRIIEMRLSLFRSHAKHHEHTEKPPLNPIKVAPPSKSFKHGSTSA